MPIAEMGAAAAILACSLLLVAMASRLLQSDAGMDAVSSPCIATGALLPSAWPTTHRHACKTCRQRRGGVWEGGESVLEPVW